MYIRGDGPLGIRTGSVRALLALIVIFVWSFLAVYGAAGHAIPDRVSQAVDTLSGVVIGFYFVTRANENGGKKVPTVDDTTANGGS